MRTAISLIFIMLALCSACKNSGTSKEPEDPGTIETAVISISGMTCTGCEETVTKAALSLEGVKDARASFKEGKAWISFESGTVSPEQISASIEKTGYKIISVNTGKQ